MIFISPLAHRDAEKLLISVEQAPEHLDIGWTLLFELIRTDQIRTIRVGRLRKVPIEACTSPSSGSGP